MCRRLQACIKEKMELWRMPKLEASCHLCTEKSCGTFESSENAVAFVLITETTEIDLRLA